MLEGTAYFVTLAMFAFVIFGTAHVRHETLILMCIPPMFVALIVGFTMWVYAFETFGLPMALAALVLPFPLAWRVWRRYSVRDLLIVIYLAWALGMVCALVAFSFPDAA
ncbi:MAG TPA: hypothetical protein VHY57_11560 [Rhizomicrobium sp.]|nr:hypothetical protein [Rhizomicrobium sp.]